MSKGSSLAIKCPLCLYDLIIATALIELEFELIISFSLNFSSCSGCILFSFIENFLDGLQEGPLISFKIISDSSPISAKYFFQLVGKVGSLFTNFKCISSMKALFDLFKNAVFSNSRFLDEDIFN